MTAVVLSSLAAGCGVGGREVDLSGCRERAASQQKQIRKEVVELVPSDVLVSVGEADDCEYPNGGGWTQVHLNETAPIKDIVDIFLRNGWSGPSSTKVEEPVSSCGDCSIEMTKKVSDGKMRMLVSGIVTEKEGAERPYRSLEVSYV
ncbi:hypothetical protein ACFQ08_04080 [Streptosporangium algeriense]|uniref:Lipoprotein n=1 Tax=Streptosporangium algeriense TaxID=1682748 RepID=A0ABW3DL70_9ACTN